MNFATLSVNIENLTQQTSEEIFIDFQIDPHKQKVEFTLQQHKILINKEEYKFEDEIYFSFGTLENFYKFLELKY